MKRLVWMCAGAAALLSSAFAGAQEPTDQQAGNANSLLVRVQRTVINELTDYPRNNPHMLQRLLTQADNPGLAAADADLTIYRYGNYCGAGWPTGLSTGPRGRAETKDERQVRHIRNLSRLRSLPKPKDYLDALCFAHDYCYDTLGRDSLACDAAMFRAALDTLEEFYRPGASLISSLNRDIRARNFNNIKRNFDNAERNIRDSATCGNQVTDVAIAFLVKPPKPKNRRELGVYSSRMYRTLEHYADGGNWSNYIKEKLALQASIGYNNGEVCTPGSAGESRPLTNRQFKHAVDTFAGYVNNENAIPVQGAQRSRFGSMVNRARSAGGQMLRAPEFEICVGDDCAGADAEMVGRNWDRLSLKLAADEAAAMALYGEQRASN